ncbi:MAG: NADPH:quinone oxidoreductase family protein [Anaerolineae bacterium]
MRAWQVTEWCEPEGMTLTDVAVPEPGVGQVRIHNRAAAVNFFDILQIQGKYQVRPPFPFTPGAEVGGVIDAVGPGVDGLAVGDRVLAMTWLGGFGEFCLAPARTTFPIPDNMSFAEAAAMPIVYQTSYLALTVRGALQPGEWLLVHAAAGGVGTSAVQIGKALGARVIGTAGSDEKLDFVRAQGADHALSYRDDTWVKQVMDITGGGANVIYDPVGGDIFDLSTKCIAPEGRLLVIGFAGGRIPSIAANRLLLKSMSAVGVYWGGYIERHPAFVAEAQAALFEMYRRGQIRPAVSKMYSLDEVPQAMRDLAGRNTMGKVVVEMNLHGR